MFPRAALAVLLVAACASKASPPHVTETPRPADPHRATGTPGKAEPVEASAGPAEPAPGASAGEWSSTVERVEAGHPVTSFRWHPSGGLMFVSESTWFLFDGDGARSLDGEELEEALVMARRSWEHPKFKWKVRFEVFWSEGNIKCDDLTGEVGARLEVCLRKATHRCNVQTFTRGGDLPFPWSEAEAPSGMEALDLLAFPSKNKVLLGRRDAVMLFTLDPLPEAGSEVKAKTPPPEDPCEAYASVLGESTFPGKEVLADLALYTSWLTGTAYTIDGTGYLFGEQGGVWLGSFEKGVDPILVVPVDAKVHAASWSPDGNRIAILDSKGGLHVASVAPPGLASITVDESVIK